MENIKVVLYLFTLYGWLASWYSMYWKINMAENYECKHDKRTNTQSTVLFFEELLTEGSPPDRDKNITPAF